MKVDINSNGGAGGCGRMYEFTVKRVISMLSSGEKAWLKLCFKAKKGKERTT